MTVLTVPTYSLCRWLLIPAMAMHNLEEWLTVPRYGSIAPALQDRLNGVMAQPTYAVLQIAWVIVTLVPAIAVFASAAADRSRWRNGLVCWIASMYLANAFLPHLLAFAMDRAYAPGLATAVFVVLPVTLLLLRQAVHEKYLTGAQAAVAIAAGVIGLPVVLALVFAVSFAVAAMVG